MWRNYQARKSIGEIAPGLMFVYNDEIYLKTTEGYAANISTGELKRFERNLIGIIVAFEYSCEWRR